MKLIVITPEEILPGEGKAMNALFEAGLPLLHLRKPQASCNEIAAWLEAVREEYHPRIVLHDCFNLLASYDLKGVHVNRRNALPPQTEKKISISKSCHSLQEAESALVDYDYFFLSPLFDSISKEGYSHAFTAEELKQARAQGILNKKAIALGGITPERVSLAAEYGFGGVAVLGALWENFREEGHITTLLTRFKEFKNKCNQL